MGSIGKAIGGTVADVFTGGAYSSKKNAKKRARAAEEMAAAMANAPEPEEAPLAETKDVSKSENDVGTAARRRYKLSDTRLKSSDGLSGMRKTLG